MSVWLSGGPAGFIGLKSLPRGFVLFSSFPNQRARSSVLTPLSPRTEPGPKDKFKPFAVTPDFSSLPVVQSTVSYTGACNASTFRTF